jgi:hypothetical protein
MRKKENDLTKFYEEKEQRAEPLEVKKDENT